MKLVRFERLDEPARARWGVAVGGQARGQYASTPADAIVDLTARLDGIDSPQALLAGGDAARQTVQALLARSKLDHRLADVRLLPPIGTPEKIFCIGVNYMERNDEYKDASALPKYPSVFTRTPNSLVGHGASLMKPPESEQLDYEGEIGLVIGTAGRRIALADASRHIGGVTCINEGTVRDWLRHGKFNVTQGKNFDGSGAIGPWLVTADEFDSFDDLQVTTRVNGEVRQQDSTRRLMFSFAYLIAYLSQFATLKPGDVIATGTPIGAGVRFDPPRFLKAGDMVEVEVSGVGILANRVAVEDAQPVDFSSRG